MSDYYDDTSKVDDSDEGLIEDAQRKVKAKSISYTDFLTLPPETARKIRERGLVHAVGAHDAYAKWQTGEWSYDQWLENGAIHLKQEQRAAQKGRK